MKTLSLCAVILFSIFSFNTSNAQTVKKETIKVWGNCGMCKTKIEKAAKSAGATSANWNADSKELKVSYAVNKTSGTKIQEAIAKTGYDTQDLTADNNAYEKLHACCKYERKDATATTTDMKKSCDHAGCKMDGKAGACKDMAGCKDMAAGKEKSCSHNAAGMVDGKKCCSEASCKHEGKESTCKDMACCKEKSCCTAAAKMD